MALQLAGRLDYISKDVLNADPSAWECPAGMHLSLAEKIVQPLIFGSYLVVGVPLVEELLREAFQRDVLDRKLTQLINKISPSKARQWQSTGGKCSRIVLTGLLFAAAHLLNSYQKNPLGISEFEFQQKIRMQAISNIGLGIVASTLQETHGFWSAYGVHMTTNMVGFIAQAYTILKKC